MCLLMAFSLCACGEKQDPDKAKEGEDVISTTEKAEQKSEISAKVGDTVSVVYNIKENSNAAAVDFVVEFDSAKLEYVKTNQIHKIDQGFLTGNLAEDGKVKVAFVTLAPPNQGGDLFSVDFKILSDCKDGTNVKIYNTSSVNLEHQKIKINDLAVKVFTK